MKNNDGNIPVLRVEGTNLPEAWERSVLATWERGIEIKTQYDNSDDPPSKDCTMVMVVKNAVAEPMIHRGFPGGLEDLEVYRQEVLDGIHDSLIDIEDETKWCYTYHNRLCVYEINGKVIDQINSYVVPAIAGTPYSRRVQATTWRVDLDPGVADPPCLQRLWFRMPKDEYNRYVLNMHTYWRSRDALKAAFMNMFVLAELQNLIANKIAERFGLGGVVFVGQMVDISDSYHIYGKDIGNADKPEPGTFHGFQKLLNARAFEERTWTSAFAEPFFEEARKTLKEERR